MRTGTQWTWSDVRECREVVATLHLSPLLMGMLGTRITRAATSARQRIVRQTGYPHLRGSRVRRVRLSLEQAQSCHCLCPAAVRRVVRT